MDLTQRVSDAKVALVAAQDSVLTQVLTDLANNAANDQKASDGTFGQADIDAAVAAAVGPLNAQITALQAQDASDIQAGKDAVSAVQAAMDALQAQYSALAAKESTEAGTLQGLVGSISALQGVVAVLQGLQSQPAPAPAPVPDQPVTT